MCGDNCKLIATLLPVAYDFGDSAAVDDVAWHFGIEPDGTNAIGVWVWIWNGGDKPKCGDVESIVSVPVEPDLEADYLEDAFDVDNLPETLREALQKEVSRFVNSEIESGAFTLEMMES